MLNCFIRPPRCQPLFRLSCPLRSSTVSSVPHCCRFRAENSTLSVENNGRAVAQRHPNARHVGAGLRSPWPTSRKHTYRFDGANGILYGIKKQARRQRISILQPGCSFALKPLKYRAARSGKTLRSLQRNVKKPGRVKYVSLGTWAPSSSWLGQQIALPSQRQGLDPLDRSWSERFQAVSNGRRLNLDLIKINGELIQRYAGLHMSPRVIHRTWLQIPAETQPKIWQELMLWCLQNSPRRALKLLLATSRNQKLRPSRHVVGDCLWHLAKHFLDGESRPDPLAWKSIYHLTCTFVEGGNNDMGRTYAMPGNLVHLILKHSDNNKTASFIELLGSNNVDLHVNTLLQVLERSVGMGKVSLSMQILGCIARSGFDLSRDQVQSACVRLLRTSFDAAEPYIVQAKILTQILEMGIRPKIAMYNAIILNTIEAGDLDTAWQMYDVAKANNLEPNSITYGILLKGARLSEDFSLLERVISETQKHLTVVQDLRLFSDLLNALSVQMPKSHEKQYPYMLELYKQRCYLEPLRDLGMCGPETLSSPESKTELKWPTPHVLAQMFLAYIRLHQTSDGLIAIYQRYHELVKQNHPLIAPLASKDYISNAFVIAFGRRAETLQHCTTVVKHMLDPPVPSTTETELPLTISPPTVRTWSILAAAYFSNNQKLAAEKVLTLMRERGLRGDKVTWNIIVSGYSGMQNVEAAVDAMKRMEADGYQADSRTLQGLGRLYNRDKLLNSLRRSMGKEGVVVGRGVVVAGEPGKSSDSDAEDRRAEVIKYLES